MAETTPPGPRGTNRDDETTAELSVIELLRATLSVDRLPVPAEPRQRVLALAKPRANTKKAFWRGFQLCFDSALQLRPAHLRGPANWRHAIYLVGEPDAAELRLEVTAERAVGGRGWSVTGQVQKVDGGAWSGRSIELQSGVAAPVSETTDESGQFVFLCGDEGPWQLLFELAGGRRQAVPVLTPAV